MAFALVSASSVAFAEAPVVADSSNGSLANTPRTGERAPTGLELMVRPGIGASSAGSPLVFTPSNRVVFRDPGGIFDGTASPYSAGFTGDAFVGGRFARWGSVGLRGGLRTFSAKAPADGTEALSRTSWNAGLYARAYLEPLTHKLVPNLDPWVSVGVAYSRDVQSYRRPVPTTVGAIVTDWTLDHHSVAVPLGVGVDYRIWSRVAVGPSFEYTPVFGLAGCTTIGGGNLSTATVCSTETNGVKVSEARNYGAWTAALDVRVTLF